MGNQSYTKPKGLKRVQLDLPPDTIATLDAVATANRRSRMAQGSVLLEEALRHAVVKAKAEGRDVEAFYAAA